MKEAFYDKILKEHNLCPDCPTPQEVVAFLKKLSGFFFQDFAVVKMQSVEQLKGYEKMLKDQFIDFLQRNPMNFALGVDKLADGFFNQLPEIYERLCMDIDATFEGDPAAKNRREIIRSYPGFYAIMAHRIAHAMLQSDVQDLPRIISEYAHSKTGIDIHPGATIGDSFCIDHGTGIVIGETSIIGNNVKLYQGVTLGALSVNKEDASKKRHPTIEDNVVIYSSAVILGGKTVIGANAVIGGNVFITRSVAPGTKVYYKVQLHDDTKEEVDTYVFKEEF